jgi:hypothetical protein
MSKMQFERWCICNPRVGVRIRNHAPLNVPSSSNQGSTQKDPKPTSRFLRFPSQRNAVTAWKIRCFRLISDDRKMNRLLQQMERKVAFVFKQSCYTNFISKSRGINPPSLASLASIISEG